jgi:hypothetical protein
MFDRAKIVRTVVAVLALGVVGTVLVGTGNSRKPCGYRERRWWRTIRSAIARQASPWRSWSSASRTSRIWGGHDRSMKKAAPIETVSKLVSLKNSRGRNLLSQKQIILLCDVL